MKKNELIKLRELVNEEIKRRERISYLQEQDLIKEYLELIEINPKKNDSNNIRSILKELLKEFEITKTNKIYVCTNSYYIDYDICYEDTNYYTKDVKIDSEYAEYKIYKDIESGKIIKASKEIDKLLNRPLIEDIESNNIVLNPYNNSNNLNGYNDVRLDFFEESLINGQTKGKQKILKKYNRI